MTSNDYPLKCYDRSVALVNDEVAIHAFKARLDSAIKAEKWHDADKMRIAAKRILIELLGRSEDPKKIEAARDALADSLARLRLSHRMRIEMGALTMATKLDADAETAGIAAEAAPLPPNTARNVGERIIQILSSGNQRPWTTTELAEAAECEAETASRALSQLRAAHKIVSRRVGRHVLHHIAKPEQDTVIKMAQGIEKSGMSTLQPIIEANWTRVLTKIATDPTKKVWLHFDSLREINEISKVEYASQITTSR